MDAFHAGDLDKVWPALAKVYMAEIKKPDASRVLDVLAALSQSADFSVSCYCEDEKHCHRSLLRELLIGRGAEVRL